MPHHISFIGGVSIEQALLYLGENVNLLPYLVYIQLGLGELKPTRITFFLADRLVNIPRGIIEDVLVQVNNFYFPVDFFILDPEPAKKGPNHILIILGRPFPTTSNALIKCKRHANYFWRYDIGALIGSFLTSLYIIIHLSFTFFYGFLWTITRNCILLWL